MDSEVEFLRRDLEEREQKFLKDIQSIASGKPRDTGPQGRLISTDGRETRAQRSQPRGPRKPAEPRPDIKARLFRANQAFLGGDSVLAMELTCEIIRINAEVHQAWTLLAAVHRELGAADKALLCMVSASHLQPKVLSSWLDCAELALDIGNLMTARYCYSAALRADRNCLRALTPRADIFFEQGKLAYAISDYRRILEQQPKNLDVIRKLAEACVDYKEDHEASATAISAYRHYLGDAEPTTRGEVGHISWPDISIFAQLFANSGRHQEAIREIKSLARRQLGRQGNLFWDEWQVDDREWDRESDRRLEVAQFSTDNFDLIQYGLGLPLDLRAQLALYRLRLRDEEEGMVGRGTCSLNQHR
jgi:general transcription factor 3C polypeptide 3 (transcription factor C subunit 4)